MRIQQILLKRIAKLTCCIPLVLILILVIIPHKAYADTYTTIFSDDFTDSNGTSLTSHNNNWTVTNTTNNPRVPGTATIQNNTVVTGANNENDFLTIPSSFNALDQCVSADYLFPMAAHATYSVFARVVTSPLLDGATFYQSYLNQNDHTTSISRIVNGNVDNQVITLDPWPSDGWHNYKLCAIGSQITEYFDNNLVQTRNDSNITSPGSALFEAYGGGGSGNVTIDNFLVKGINSAPSVNTISVSSNPIQVNNSITASANFTDPNTSDTHTAIWNWGDGSSSATVTESNGSGSVSNNHTYTAVGVYTVTLTVTDNHGASGASTYQYVSVYDANTSFAGGHSFDNPSSASPNISGKVTFGVSAKYNNSNVLTGTAKMNFKTANIDFASTSLTSLASSNGKAYLKGTGTVNGSGSYTFLATGIDGSVVGGQDMIRFQIKDSSANVVYDSQPGASDTTDPSTVVANGNVRVH